MESDSARLFTMETGSSRPATRWNNDGGEKFREIAVRTEKTSKGRNGRRTPPTPIRSATCTCPHAIAGPLPIILTALRVSVPRHSRDTSGGVVRLVKQQMDRVLEALNVALHQAAGDAAELDMLAALLEAAVSARKISISWS